MPARIRKFCKESGQSGELSDAEVARAIYDSLALYFKSKLSLLENILNVKYSAFNIVGGGTRDALLMQLTSNALGIPVIAGPVEATSTGNIIAQAIASGVVKDQQQGRDIIADSFDVITYNPDPQSHNIYKQLEDKFNAVINN